MSATLKNTGMSANRKYRNLPIFRLCSKMGCVFPMVILSEFRIGQYGDDDHWDDAPHFNFQKYPKFYQVIFFNSEKSKFWTLQSLVNSYRKYYTHTICVIQSWLFYIAIFFKSIRPQCISV